MCLFSFFPLESQMKEQTFKLSGDKSVLKVVVKYNKKKCELRASFVMNRLQLIDHLPLDKCHQKYDQVN